MKKIPITKPSFNEEDFCLIQEPLKSGWVVQGPFVEKFENLFCEFTGAKYAIATTSCTTALHLSLIVAGIQTGDAVIVPAFTWVASANVVEQLHATPIFCDIDPKTYNIDPNQIEELLKKDKKRRIKAIMPVHLFGLCAPMQEILFLAKKYHLKVIEDAACGLGSFINKKHAGTFGELGCFSFHPRKIITTGEGGMIVTNSKALASRCRRLRDHGADITDLKRHNRLSSFLMPQFSELGYNYRLTDFQAALGVAQMKKLAPFLKKRKAIAEKYNNELPTKQLQLPVCPSGFTHSYQSYVLSIKAAKNQPQSLGNITKLGRLRNQIVTSLANQGISTRPGTLALHTLNYYKKKYQFKPESYIHTLAASLLSFSLPLYHELGEREQNKIIKALISQLA